MPRPQNEALFKRYEALAKAERDVTFVGRLAQYRYYNMDQCVGAALKASETVLAKLGAETVVRVPAMQPAHATFAMEAPANARGNPAANYAK